VGKTIYVEHPDLPDSRQVVSEERFYGLMVRKGWVHVPDEVIEAEVPETHPRDFSKPRKTIARASTKATATTSTKAKAKKKN